MTIIDDQEHEEREDELDLAAPETRAAGRWNSAGVPGERSKDFKSALRRLGRMLGPMWIVLLVVAVIAIASATLNVFGPRVLGHGTDLIVRGVVSHRGIDFGALHHVLLQALALYAASSGLSIIAAYMLAGVIQRLMYKLRSDVEDKVNALPLRYIDRQQRGDLLSRVTNDIDNVAQSLQQTLSQMLTSVLLLLGVAIMMFTISPLLAVVALTTVPVSVFGMRAVARRARPRFMSQWKSTGILNAQIEETFTGHAVVKAFGRQREVEQRFRDTNDELFESSFGAQFMSSLMQPFTMFMGNIQYVIVAVVGGLRVSSGAITVGDIQAFIQYSRNFSMPLTQLASMMNVFQSGIASFERVVEFLDAEEQSPDPVASDNPPPVRGRVEFRDVTFSYDPDRPLIESLSLVAEPGQTIAIVGPTGAGKTTLVNLLMRFYELNGGVITLDGRDISSIPRAELRSQIGMVLQDTWLFGGTIRDNIAYGNPDATDAQILEAARATYVDRFVHSLPDGYDTLINEEGDNISAGQKQLLTIARAFLAEPSILILDEATSSVDTRTEVLIQEAMNALRKDRTSFVIAHRLSTIRGADTILVMEHGSIVEQGSHNELLGRDGPYARLYNSQFVAPVVDVV
ncbi:MAG TPA: ABC transporter ATP-binding protein [Acidimicrobiia bacterium]|nr:ABC transporter ATP-binding protein [Acidimicrobiia bacterium]